MGTVFAEITLKNGSDLVLAQNGHINDKDVRSLTVNALVDTGAITLVINEDICRKLGLVIESTRTAFLAGGAEASCKVTEPVRIYWKNRDATCRAWVLPGGDEALLGAIPLEEMDLAVDPVNKELYGVHGDEVVGLIK
jgi:clan AA aspartic protease